jgi:alanine dehydrogenase
MIIGIIKERKNPPDNRVALTPVQCVSLKHKFPEVEIIVESCSTRCFSDDEYREAGIDVVNDVSSAEVMLGIKEVPKEALIPNKTYFFFSHTIKKQPYNRDLLREVLKKNIRLIDYEVLKWETGQRVLGFGKWAGIVGAYNGLMVYGKKTGLFSRVKTRRRV